MITLDGIVVPYSGIYEGRDIEILFDCTWDVENGFWTCCNSHTIPLGQ